MFRAKQSKLDIIFLKKLFKSQDPPLRASCVMTLVSSWAARVVLRQRQALFTPAHFSGAWNPVRGAHAGDTQQETEGTVPQDDTPAPPPPPGPPRPPVDPASARRVRRRELRWAFPEFLPDPDQKFRNPLVERLQRRDMLARREAVELPEFYVGSLVAVTAADPNSTAPNRLSRFLGLCIARGGCGLRAWCVVRNVVDSQGVEFLYELYSPVVHKVEVVRLRKHVDDEMYYLRDVGYEHQTFPQDMEAEILPEGTPVPIEDTVYPLRPRPWTRNWELLEVSRIRQCVSSHLCQHLRFPVLFCRTA